MTPVRRRARADGRQAGESTLGIIDVGTNSVQLLVAWISPRGYLARHPQRWLVRLGEGGLVRNRLTAPAMNRAMKVLGRFASSLRRFKVDRIEAVATSAVREAANGPVFVRRVRTQTGLPLRIISGQEEARLIYLGVRQESRLRGATVMITIGGGSVQIIHGQGRRVRYAASFPLGCARLAQQFLRHDPPWPREVTRLEDYVRRALRGPARRVKWLRWDRAVGSSSMIAQLMRVQYFKRHRLLSDERRMSLDQSGLRGLIEQFASMNERKRLPGLDPARRDLALPTAITLLAWMEACGISRLRYAPGSLREGLVVDAGIRHNGGKRLWSPQATRER